MNMRFGILCGLIIFGANYQVQNANAEELVTLQYRGLTLSASLNSGIQNIKGRRVFLILHGTLAHRNMEIMTQLRSVLADHNEIALAPTLSLGLDAREGMYPCSAEHRHLHNDALDELKLWHEWLNLQGAESVVLTGHSRGANQVALWLAGQASNNISAAILVAPPNRAGANAVARTAKNSLPDSVHLSNAEDALITVPEFLHCRDTKVSVSTLRSYSQPSASRTSDLLKAINKPVLIVLGSDDQIVKATDWDARKFSGDSVTVVIIEGADHFFRDLYADELVESALSWLSE